MEATKKTSTTKNPTFIKFKNLSTGKILTMNAGDDFRELLSEQEDHSFDLLIKSMLFHKSDGRIYINPKSENFDNEDERVVISQTRFKMTKLPVALEHNMCLWMGGSNV